jgi:hypothetical protein
MHLRRTGASMVMTMVYGLDPVMSEEDPEVVAINESANRQTTAALPGNYWVEFFPWMKHIPSSCVLSFSRRHMLMGLVDS